MNLNIVDIFQSTAVIFFDDQNILLLITGNPFRFLLYTFVMTPMVFHSFFVLGRTIGSNLILFVFSTLAWFQSFLQEGLVLSKMEIYL